MLLKRKTILVFFAAMFVQTLAYAQTGEVRQWYRGARSLGMGGASVAIVNDETALLSNPAALGRLRSIYGTILDPELEGSTNWPTLYTTQAYTDPFSIEAMAPTLAASPGTAFHAKAQLFPSFVARNFGFGVYGKRLLDATVDNTGSNMQTFYQDDLAVLLGFNFSLWGGRIKIGATGKAISRIEINKNLPLSGPLDVPSNASEGLGLGYDAGVVLTAPYAWLPTLAAVAHDVGGTRFDAMTGVRMSTATRPDPVTQDYDVGISLSPIHSKNSRSVFTIEAQQITAAQSATDKYRYAHVGYEYNFADILFLRAGMNGRYWTTGIEFASEHTQIQFAYYGQDIGVDGAPQEDRRWVWKFGFRF